MPPGRPDISPVSRDSSTATEIFVAVEIWRSEIPPVFAEFGSEIPLRDLTHLNSLDDGYP